MKHAVRNLVRSALLVVAAALALGIAIDSTAQSTAVIHCRIRPYSAEKADSPAGGRNLRSLVCQPRTFSSPATKPIDFRHSRGKSRSRRPGSEVRAYSCAKPFQAPLPTAARTSASRQPRAAAAIRTAMRASLRPG